MYRLVTYASFELRCATALLRLWDTDDCSSCRDLKMTAQNAPRGNLKITFQKAHYYSVCIDVHVVVSFSQQHY